MISRKRVLIVRKLGKLEEVILIHGELGWFERK